MVLDPAIFTEYDFETNELYEGMLIQLANPDSTQDLFVVEQNADGTSNFGEYRVGADTLDPATGARVLAGRNDGRNAFGSLNFSFINDSLWIGDAGILNVDACVVDYRDTLTTITGIMYYSFGNFKLLPRNNDDMENFRGGCLSGVPTDLEDDLKSSLVNVYPNPVQDELTLEVDFPQLVDTRINLYDLAGRTVSAHQYSMVRGTVNMNIRDLQVGTYIVVVEAEGVIVKREKILIIR